jgi:hypothetical protein
MTKDGPRLKDQMRNATRDTDTPFHGLSLGACRLSEVTKMQMPRPGHHDPGGLWSRTWPPRPGTGFEGLSHIPEWEFTMNLKRHGGRRRHSANHSQSINPMTNDRKVSNLAQTARAPLGSGQA